MERKDEHFLKIKTIYPDMINISKPVTLGCIRSVYIVEDPKGKFICRFVDQNAAKHNLKASKTLRAYGIPVPDVQIYAFDGSWCETYPFIPGKTFHERLLEGLPKEKIDDIYQQIFNISYKISEIPYDDSFNVSMPFATKIIHSGLSLFSSEKTVLIHSDLHAKNVILDDNDNVSGILDLDTVSPDKLTVANAITMRDAQQVYGYDIKRFSKLNISGDFNDLERRVNIWNIFAKFYKKIPNIIVRQTLKIWVR